MLGASVAFLLACLVARGACADSNQTQEEADGRPFSCEGRPSGYYADVASDCQRYHLCDGGRRFTHACPDMTRFQQRMMVCDHWYAVDCSAAEDDFGANLLIGRRDQPSPEHRAPGRRRALQRGLPAEPSTPRAEGRGPRITFRYVEATSPADHQQGASESEEKPPAHRRVALPRQYSDNLFLRSFVETHDDGEPVPTERTTTLAPVTGNLFLAPLFARRTTPTTTTTTTTLLTTPLPDPREYVEVRIPDPRLMFYIPGAGDGNHLGPGGDSTVLIHLDHGHDAMVFRPEGRRAPAGGRDPRCPACLPAFLAPGRCEPCVTVR